MPPKRAKNIPIAVVFDRNDPWYKIKRLNISFLNTYMKKTAVPEWAKLTLRSFLTTETNNRRVRGSNYLFKGSSKMVFSIEGHACSVEVMYKENKARREFITDRLRKIGDPCGLVIPSQAYNIDIPNKNYCIYLQQMKYCVNGDLFRKPPTKYANFSDMALTLQSLHRNGVYLLDIKPENMLDCTCEGESVFAFADLDDSVVREDESPKFSVTPGFGTAILFLENVPENYEFIDWLCFAKSALEVAFKKTYQPYLKADEKFLDSVRTSTDLTILHRCAEFLRGLESEKDSTGRTIDFFTDKEQRDEKIELMASFRNENMINLKF